MSAIKAGMSRNTARKHFRQDDVMEQQQAPHTWEAIKCLTLYREKKQ